MDNKIYLYDRNGHLHFSTNAPAFHSKSRLVQTANFEVVERPALLPGPANALFLDGEIIDGSPFINDYIRLYNVNH